MIITIDTETIKAHGAEWTCILELIQLHRLQTPDRLADAMGCTVRHIDKELTSMSSKKLIDYVINPKGQKRAFVI